MGLFQTTGGRELAARIPRPSTLWAGWLPSPRTMTFARRPGLSLSAVLRSLLDLPPDVAPTDVPQRPQGWDQLCGWYSFGPGVLTDPQPRMLGAGVDVAVRGGSLTLRGQIPVPAVRKGLSLHPDRDDPDVFRVDLPGDGSGTSVVVFSRDPAGRSAPCTSASSRCPSGNDPLSRTRGHGSPARSQPAR